MKQRNLPSQMDNLQREKVKKVCYIMVGVSGSGKSTFAHRLWNRHHRDENVAVFSLDSCRLDFLGLTADDPKKAYDMAF